MVVQRSLYFLTSIHNRASTLWALQEAMQRFLGVARGQDGVKQVPAASALLPAGFSLPYTPSSEELQCSCLVFLLGDYRNPVFYSSFESPFLQHVTCVALGFL